ncbi:uncharacterized protein LOC126674719 [Mercurialis annua]|uniref:uncharacterized protein LOC126674719 n=1 Tax=Mercurialis annua TaxID=3986 RepID=UPI00215F98BD|nr:uncharacterized protein LOC126674719 [Mercurialis annua]
MCSHSSSGGDGGGSGGGGDHGGGGGVDSLYSRKPYKRQRVPKRGPGVAELEKILREQETKNITVDKANNSYQSQSGVLAPSNCVPLAPKPSHSTLVGVKLDGSNVVLPERTLLPTMWNSESNYVSGGGSRSVPGFAFSTPNQFHDPSLMQRFPSSKFHYPQPVVSSSSTPLFSVPCHGIEPPSNQRIYHHSTSLWPEEDKMVGTKRSRPFSMEIHPVPALHYPVPTFPSQFNGSDHSSFPCSNHSITDLQPNQHFISREIRPNLEPNIRNYNTDNGSVSEGKFLLFGCPTTPPSTTHTLQQDRPKSNHFPLQENGGGIIPKKPFYSFLNPREPIGLVENERIENRGDAIDLNLRL